MECSKVRGIGCWKTSIGLGRGSYADIQETDPNPQIPEPPVGHINHRKTDPTKLIINL